MLLKYTILHDKYSCCRQRPADNTKHTAVAEQLRLTEQEDMPGILTEVEKHNRPLHYTSGVPDIVPLPLAGARRGFLPSRGFVGCLNSLSGLLLGVYLWQKNTKANISASKMKVQIVMMNQYFANHSVTP